MEVRTLLDACQEVIKDPSVLKRYPEGLLAKDILTEIRVKHGENAFPYVSILDVIDEMNKIYPRS